MIAVLYNTEEELEKQKLDWSHLLLSKNVKGQVLSYDAIGDVIFCKCDLEEAFRKLNAVHLSGYFVLGDSLYSGEVLRYVASRWRK